MFILKINYADFGHLSIFGLANKLITTGEGGMILTDSKKYSKTKTFKKLRF